MCCVMKALFLLLCFVGAAAFADCTYKVVSDTISATRTGAPGCLGPRSGVVKVQTHQVAALNECTGEIKQSTYQASKCEPWTLNGRYWCNECGTAKAWVFHPDGSFRLADDSGRGTWNIKDDHIAIDWTWYDQSEFSVRGRYFGCWLSAGENSLQCNVEGLNPPHSFFKY